MLLSSFYNHPVFIPQIPAAAGFLDQNWTIFIKTKQAPSADEDHESDWKPQKISSKYLFLSNCCFQGQYWTLNIL